VRRFLLASLFSIGCVVPDVSVEGHACPCPAGYVCDGATQTCVAGIAPTTSSGLGGGAPTGSSSSGVAVCAGVCGTPGCGACPDVPVVDAGGFGVDALEATRGDYERFLADAVDPAGQSPQCQWNTSYEPIVDADAGCPDAYDFSQADYPISCIDWCDAAAFCAWAGKRMCGRKGGGTVGVPDVNDASVSEWYAACSAGGTLAFPYGDTYDAMACNTFGNASDLVGTGWFVDCEGGYPGVFDMVGNVEEWEAACDTFGATTAQDNCELRGGAFWSDGSEYSRCGTGNRGPDRGTASHDWGFRCCGALR